VCKTVNFKHLDFEMKLLALARLQVFGRKYILLETGTVPSSVEIVGRHQLSSAPPPPPHKELFSIGGEPVSVHCLFMYFNKVRFFKREVEGKCCYMLLINHVGSVNSNSVQFVTGEGGDILLNFQPSVR
jgi:hypothetical protein